MGLPRGCGVVTLLWNRNRVMSGVIAILDV